MGTGKVKISAQIWTLCGPRPGKLIEIVSNDIPSDADVVCAGYDVDEDTIVLEFKSHFIPDDEVKWYQGPIFREMSR
jgi:hypothetical protein